jgi:hypothetical protein
MIRRRWTAGDWLAALIGALLGFVLVADHRADAQQRRVEAWGGITHTSNLFRGCPLRCGVPELTQDCILGGITRAGIMTGISCQSDTTLAQASLGSGQQESSGRHPALSA